MPVISTATTAMGPGNRPDWCGVTSSGVFRVLPGGRFDCHYHDCHEYWLIYSGKAKVMSEGREAYVQAGDIVCTRAGDEHDVLEVYEPLEAFWFEDSTPLGGRVGHLHRDADKARGHEVPHRAVPVDFPGPAR
jgi:mannose-6-phosphate isomerase-like protein (cupin superfamily)